jgi:hypothetical protein
MNDQNLFSFFNLKTTFGHSLQQPMSAFFALNELKERGLVFIFKLKESLVEVGNNSHY